MKSVFVDSLSMILVLLALATTAHGDLLIEESFEYDFATWNLVVGSNNNLTVTGLDGGTGFAADSDWGVCLQSTTPGIEGILSIVDGLTFEGLQTSGNALFTRNTDNSALASRPIGITVEPGDTVWTSYLWQYTATPMGGVQSSYSQLTDAQFGSTNRRLRILPNQYGSNTKSAMSSGITTHELTRPELQDGDTYLMIGRNTNIGQAGTGTLWAMVESDFALCAADGVVTEQELDDHCVGTTTGNLEMNTITSGAFLQLAHVWGAGTFDEFRMGTTLADVTPVGSSSGLQGDLNNDGFVGGDDLDIVRSFWGQNVTAGDLLSGDPSEDGFVGGDDLDIVRANWGQGTPPAPTAVPEPGTTLLLISALGFLAMAAFARREA